MILGSCIALLDCAEPYHALAVNEDEFFEQIMPRDLQIWEGAPAFPDHACSLIRFPFIYDPASKARLLGASNNRSQWEEFQNAFLEAITQGGALPYMLLRVSCYPETCLAYLTNPMGAM